MNYATYLKFGTLVAVETYMQFQKIYLLVPSGLLTLMMLVFFFDKNSTFTQNDSVRAVLLILQFCFQFL